MAEPQPRTNVGERVGRLLADPGRPRAELLKRLGVARNLTAIWLRNPDNDGEWMPKIVHVRLSIDAADAALTRADNIESRAIYKEAGDSFYQLWSELSKSDIPPSIVEETLETLGKAGDAVKKAAEIGFGTIMIGLGIFWLVTRGSKHD